MKTRLRPTLLTLAVALAAAGCASSTTPAKPWRTRWGAKLSTLNAQQIGDYLVVEAKWDRYGPYHFVVDTGSTATLASPELVLRYPSRVITAPPVLVRSGALGEGTVSLAPAELTTIQLDETRFENVPVLIFDCTAISAHLGIKIDAILGFPLFRDTILTLDYPRKRVLLAPPGADEPLPGSTVEFDNASRTPLIPIRLGDTSVIVLVDSGSDGGLTLNPAAMPLAYAVPPREGTIIATITGQHPQSIGRLAGTVQLGAYPLEKPIVELTDRLASIGGALLRNFTVTFNQQRNRVTFYREEPGAVTFPARRSAGMSFAKEPGAYWRVIGVVPGSPAAAAAVQIGDLVTRINGDPVDQWNLTRFEQAIASTDELRVTFLNGARETEKGLKVFEIVP